MDKDAEVAIAKELRSTPTTQIALAETLLALLAIERAYYIEDMIGIHLRSDSLVRGVFRQQSFFVYEVSGFCLEGLNERREMQRLVDMISVRANLVVHKQFRVVKSIDLDELQLYLSMMMIELTDPKIGTNAVIPTSQIAGASLPCGLCGRHTSTDSYLIQNYH